MIWLVDNDLNKLIKAENLSAIIEDDASILADAELATLQEIEGYLSNRYDVPAIWQTVGLDRNAMLVMRACDIMLYHIHSRINPNRIPDLRIDRYNQAIDFLKSVAKGLLSPNLPTITTENGTTQTTFKYGSELKRRY